jgi:hypothetical protein
MTAKENAEYLINRMNNVDLNCKNESMCMLYPHAIECALIAVDEIINSNPHSNPFNTELYSTMGYWIEVKNEILTIKSK